MEMNELIKAVCVKEEGVRDLSFKRCMERLTPVFFEKLTSESGGDHTAMQNVYNFLTKAGHLELIKVVYEKRGETTARDFKEKKYGHRQGRSLYFNSLEQAKKFFIKVGFLNISGSEHE